MYGLLFQMFDFKKECETHQQSLKTPFIDKAGLKYFLFSRAKILLRHAYIII